MTRASDSLYRLLDSTPAGIAVLYGPQHVFAVVNPRYELLVNRPAADLLGKPLKDALPETAEQGFVALLDHVRESGEPYLGNEVEVSFHEPGSADRTIYVDFVYQPMPDDEGAIDRILVHATEVTKQVLARREVESLAKDLE
ncbi:MAG: PAS domain-containing protein, partial [Tepidiformaceae bacterium]